jgi:hypothetical protein
MKGKVLESMAGQGEQRVSIQSINIELPEESAKGWGGIIWLLTASIPAAVGGAVLHPAINSLISKSAHPAKSAARWAFPLRHSAPPTPSRHCSTARSSKPSADPSRFLWAG